MVWKNFSDIFYENWLCSNWSCDFLIVVIILIGNKLEQINLKILARIE